MYSKYAGIHCEKLIFAVLSEVVLALTAENWNYRAHAGPGCYLPFCIICYFQLSLHCSKDILVETILLMS